MLNHNSIRQNLFNFNDDCYMSIKFENDFLAHKFQKESIPLFSQNLLDVPSLKESTDPLIDDENSEFSQLFEACIVNIENLLSFEEREEEYENIFNLKSDK